MAVIEAIKTLYLEADSSSVTIDSIPSTYQHLELRMTHKGSYYTTGTGIYMRVGSTTTGLDSGSNYSDHIMYASGSSVSAYRRTGQTLLEMNTVGTQSAGGDYIGTQILFYDYANTNKRTSVHWYNPKIPNQSIYMFVGGGFWNTNHAVDRINFTTYSGSLVRGSEFCLYGIKSS
jgi:hypothetical protein